MDLDEYQEFIIPRSNVDVTDTASFALCGLGLAEESLEVIGTIEDEPDLAPNELGDVLWYVVAALACLGVKPSELPRKEVDVPDDSDLSLWLLFEACTFAGLAKKVWNHKHPLERHRLEMAGALDRALGDIEYLADELGFSLEQIADVNVAKLKRRYPSGFDPQASLHRHDD